MENNLSRTENPILVAVSALGRAKEDFSSKLEMFENQIRLRRKQVAEIEKEIKSMEDICDEMCKKMQDIDNVIEGLTNSFNLQPSID